MSCAKFLYLTAGDGPDGLRRQYVTWNQTIDPRLMDRHRDTSFTRGLMEQTYPGCTTHVNAQAFHASIWQDMGLSAEACRLLHKIQSADAPSKLDDIFKQGVLDVPESIRLARETVDDYNRFSENFHSMEDKMERVAILQDIQARYGEYAKQASERREYTPIDPRPRARRDDARLHGHGRAWPAKYAPDCHRRNAKPRNPRTPSTGLSSASTNSTRKSKPSKNA